MLGWRDDGRRLSPATVSSVSHGDPVTDRLRGWSEFTREIIRITARVDQFNDLSAKFRRIRRTGFGLVEASCETVGGSTKPGQLQLQ